MRDSESTKVLFLANASKQFSNITKLWGIGYSTLFSFHKHSKVSFSPSFQYSNLISNLFPIRFRVFYRSYLNKKLFLQKLRLNAFIEVHCIMVLEGFWQTRWLYWLHISCHHTKLEKRGIDIKHNVCNQKTSLEDWYISEDQIYYFVI